MSVLDTRTTMAFLALIDVTPDGTPGEFDRLQRGMATWWAQGGSCRAFIERERLARTPEAQLRRRWRPGCSDPYGG